MTAPFQVLQITDSHVLRRPSDTLLGVDTSATLRAVLTQALAEQAADAIVASGDLTHHGEADAYQRFLDIVKQRFDGPLLYLPGNHDLAAALVATLGDTGSLVLGDWEILAFDSHVDDQVEGEVDAATRNALLARIRDSAARHLLLACHHPPVPVGCPWLDQHRIPDGRELLESCAAAGRARSAAASRVRGLVVGHIHQELAVTVANVAVLGTPSTCFQFQPRSPDFAIDRGEVTGQPGYRWLTLHDDGRIDTRVGRLRGEPLNIVAQNRI